MELLYYHLSLCIIHTIRRVKIFIREDNVLWDTKKNRQSITIHNGFEYYKHLILLCTRRRDTQTYARESVKGI